MTRRAWLSVALLVLLQGAAVLVYLRIESGRQGTQAPFHYERVAGRPALPKLELMRIDGSTVRVAELHGRPILLHFWATWCPPCREELPGLLRLARDQPELQVLAVTLDEDWAVVQRFFEGNVPAAIVRDPGATLVQTYEVGTLPDTYLFDRGGRTELRFGGARNWESDSARSLLGGFLSGRGQP